MADKFTWDTGSKLSQIKIGESYYFLKDKKAREIIESFTKDIVTGAITSAITGTGTGFTTEGAVKNYVDAQVGAINKFDVIVADALPTASASTMYKIYLLPHAHNDATNVTGGSDAKDEWITVRSGSADNYTYAWEKIGNTDVNLSDYITSANTVAGVSFGSDHAITSAELATALALGALAYKDDASTTVNDYASGISGASYTPAGSVTVGLNYDATAMTSTGSFTPEGDISGTVTPTGSVGYAKDANGSYQITGSVSAPSVSVTLSSDNFIKSVKTAGTLPTFSEGAFTAATLSHNENTFATAGVTAAVGSGDDAETLIFTAASVASASLVTAFSGGSKASDTFTAGAMPTFNSGSAAVGVESASAGAPTFTGDKFNLSFSGNENTISAAFTGTEGSLSVSGNYDKAKVQSASFAGTAATITPTLTKGNKTITVS